MESEGSVPVGTRPALPCAIKVHSEERLPKSPTFKPSNLPTFKPALASTFKLLPLALLPSTASAAKIGDLTASDWVEQALRFFTLADPAVRTSLLGCVLLGIACGLLGSLLLVRRLSLTGDALSHAVLPGIVLGFLWHGTRNPWMLLAGATLTGLLSLGLLMLLRRTTRLKEDALLGLVLTGFYAAGVFLLSLAQRSGGGGQAGLDAYLLGQAAAITSADVAVIATSTALAAGFLFVCRRELLTHAFDPGFAAAAGMPVRWLERLLMLLLTFTIISALQAVGVVLVSALLITPAATASLLVRRLTPLCLLAALLGMVGAAGGSFISYLDAGLPTGPFIVLTAAFLFLLALLFAPEKGVLSRVIRHRRAVRRIRMENLLKRAYHALEAQPGGEHSLHVEALAPAGAAPAEAARTARALLRSGFATRDTSGKRLLLTPDGRRRAAAIVRNHRLWELYLTHAAHVPADHVHDDAEDMEHLLDDETVRRLERRLEFASIDPHGRKIPRTDEVES